MLGKKIISNAAASMIFCKIFIVHLRPVYRSHIGSVTSVIIITKTEGGWNSWAIRVIFVMRLMEVTAFFNLSSVL